MSDEYVRLCDVAIEEAERLRDRWEANGATKPSERAQRAVDLLRAHRETALAGRLRSSNEGFGFGPGRFVSEYDWGPEGRAFVDAVYELGRFWEEHI